MNAFDNFLKDPSDAVDGLLNKFENAISNPGNTARSYFDNQADASKAYWSSKLGLSDPSIAQNMEGRAGFQLAAFFLTDNLGDAMQFDSGGGKLLTQTERATEGGGFTTLYHGTSSEAAAAIRANGIDLSFSRANLDFGKGFYTTTDLGQAQAWAARQGGEVLTFNVPNSQLGQLSHLQFPGANGAWADFVGANRGGASLHGFDAVSGPMLGNPRAFMNGASPTAFGQQMSFHSDTAINLLNNSLLP